MGWISCVSPAFFLFPSTSLALSIPSAHPFLPPFLFSLPSLVVSLLPSTFRRRSNPTLTLLSVRLQRNPFAARKSHSPLRPDRGFPLEIGGADQAGEERDGEGGRVRREWEVMDGTVGFRWGLVRFVSARYSDGQASLILFETRGEGGKRKRGGGSKGRQKEEEGERTGTRRASLSSVRSVEPRCPVLELLHRFPVSPSQCSAKTYHETYRVAAAVRLRASIHSGGEKNQQSIDEKREELEKMKG